MKSLQKQVIQTVKILTLALILGLGVNYAFAVNWTPPTAEPPAGNTASPINVSGLPQFKNGHLTVGASGYTNNVSFQVLGGRVSVGAGTAFGNYAPVAGGPAQNAIKVNVERGNGAGSYIRSSDGFCIGNNCITSWPTGGGGGGQSFSGSEDRIPKFIPAQGGVSIGDSQITDNGNVGINTTNPTEKLDIDGKIRIRAGGAAAGKVLTSEDQSGVAKWATINATANCHDIMAPAGQSTPTLNCPAGETLRGVLLQDPDSGPGNSYRVRGVSCCTIN